MSFADDFAGQQALPKLNGPHQVWDPWDPFHTPGSSRWGAPGGHLAKGRSAASVAVSNRSGETLGSVGFLFWSSQDATARLYFSMRSSWWS